MVELHRVLKSLWHHKIKFCKKRKKTNRRKTEPTPEHQDATDQRAEKAASKDKTLQERSLDQLLKWRKQLMPMKSLRASIQVNRWWRKLLRRHSWIVKPHLDICFILNIKRTLWMGQRIRLCTPDLASRATNPWSLSITIISPNSSERATWRRF